MEPAAAPAFTALLDRGISAEVQLAAWCPSMDLLALVTVDGQLHVHRLNWQRLWWTAPEATVTAMAWHPNGKQLAVGLEDGWLLVLNTEDGEVLRKAQLFNDSPVVAICWAQQAQQQGASAGEALEDRARRLFRPPPPPPGAPGASAAGVSTAAGGGGGYAGLHPPAGGAGARGTAWPAQPATLALLACASGGGEVVLATAGLFRLAGLSLPQLLGGADVHVLRMAVSGSLGELVACWEESRGGRLSVSRLQLGQLGPLAPLLHTLGLMAVDLTALLAGCSLAWDSACAEWEGATREVRESLGKLEGLLRDYGALQDAGEAPGAPAGQAAVAEELSRALTTGVIGGALQQYLTVSLGEAGVKRLARAMDGAVHAVHAALIDSVAPAAQLAAFRLGELRGMAARCGPPALAALELKAEEVGAAEGLALGLLLDAERLRRAVVAVGSRYRSLFMWLLTLTRRVHEDQPDSMLGFSRRQLDALGPFLRREFVRDSMAAAMRGAPPCAEDRSRGSPPRPTEPAPPGGPRASAAPALSMVMETLQHLGTRASARQQGAPAAGPKASSPQDPPEQLRACSGPGAAPQGGQQSARDLGCGPGGLAKGNVVLRGGGLAEQLSALRAACEASLGRAAAAVGPGVKLRDSWSLGPSPSSVALEYQAPAGREGAERACVCACWRGGEGSAQPAPCMLLLRAPAGEPEAGGPAAQVEGALVRLDPNEIPVDAGFYKEGSVLMGLAAGTGAGACRVALLEQESLQLGALAQEGLLPGGAGALQALQAGRPPTGLPAGCRQRPLPYPTLHAPLAVSASRGVACVLVGTQRVMLLDLVEDEEQEEGEGEEEEDGGDPGSAGDEGGQEQQERSAGEAGEDMQG